MTYTKQWLCWFTAAFALTAFTLIYQDSHDTVRAAETESAEENSVKTDVGIAVSRVDPETLSFEVPLYVTMAIRPDPEGSGQPAIYIPENYSIKNTTPASQVDGAVPELGVTAITVETVAGGRWSLYGDVADAAQGELALEMSVGRLSLPDTKAGGNRAQVDLTAADSEFYDMANQVYRPLNTEEPGTVLELSVRLSPELPALSYDGKAAAQFRITYTLSPLDSLGKPMTVVPEYEGDGP